MAPTTNRRSFTAAVKPQVIEYAEVNGNRVAEWEFGIPESSVRAWRKAKDLLRNTQKSK